MHPILFVQIYLFLVLRTSVLMSYEYYNLGWNVHVHCTAHITQKHRQGRHWDKCSYIFSLYLDMLYLACLILNRNGFKHFKEYYD